MLAIERLASIADGGVPVSNSTAAFVFPQFLATRQTLLSLQIWTTIMNNFTRTVVIWVTAVLGIWLIFEPSVGTARNTPEGDSEIQASQSEVERTSTELMELIKQAGTSITGEKPDPTLRLDVHPIARKLIDQLTAMDPASADLDVGMGALSMLVFYAGQSDDFAKRLGMENGLQDLQEIDGLKELAVRGISSHKPIVQESGARILFIISTDDEAIELKLVELLNRTTSYSTKEVALFAIASGGFDSNEASAAVVVAIQDPKMAPTAIRALNVAGEVPPEAIPPMIEIIESGRIIITAAHSAEMLSKYFPGNQDLNRLHKLRDYIQSAESRVNAAIEQLESEGAPLP